MSYLKQNMKTGTPEESVVVIGSSSTTILTSNEARNFLLLVNDSNEDIYVSLSGADIAVGEGVRLNASGGAILLDRYIPLGEITGVCTSGSKNLLVTEG